MNNSWNRVLRVFAIVSVIGLVLFVPFIIINRTIGGIVLIGSFCSILLCWFMKSKSSPPVSLLGWIIFGENPPYSEEWEDSSLKRHHRWMVHKYTETQTLSYKLKSYVYLNQLRQYQPADYRNAIRDCEEELDSRDVSYTKLDDVL